MNDDCIKDSYDMQYILQSSSSGVSVSSSMSPMTSSVQEYLNQTNTKKEIGFADLCLSDKQKLAQMFKKLDESHKESKKYKNLYEEELQRNEALSLTNQEQQSIFEKESTELKTKYNTSASKLKKLKEKSDIIITRLAEEREKEQHERYSEVNFLREENKRMLERYGALQRDKQKLERQVEELEINRMSLVLQKKETKEMETQTNEIKPEPKHTAVEKEQQTSIITSPAKLSETKSIALEKKVSTERTSKVINNLLKRLSPEKESPTRKEPTVEYSPPISDISTRSPLLDYLSTPRKSKQEDFSPHSSRKTIDRTVDDSDLLNIVQKSDRIRKESPQKLQTNHIIVFGDASSSSYDRDFLLEAPKSKPPPHPEQLPEKKKERKEDYSFTDSYITDTSDFSDSDGEYYDEDSLLNVVKVLEEQQNLRVSCSISSSYGITDTSLDGKHGWFEK